MWRRENNRAIENTEERGEKKNRESKMKERENRKKQRKYEDGRKKWGTNYKRIDDRNTW